MSPQPPSFPLTHRPGCPQPAPVMTIYESWRVQQTECRLMVPTCPQCQRRPHWIMTTGDFKLRSLAFYLNSGNVPRFISTLFQDAGQTTAKDVAESLGIAHNTLIKYEKEGFPRMALCVLEFIIRRMHKGLDCLNPSPDYKALRTAAGYSIRDWAELLNVSDRTVTRWESGHTNDQTVGFYNLLEWDMPRTLLMLKRHAGPPGPVPLIIEVQNTRTPEPLEIR